MSGPFDAEPFPDGSGFIPTPNMANVHRAEMERAQLVPPQASPDWHLTFEIIFAHAFSPLHDKITTVDGVTKIPVSMLKRR